VRLKIGDLNEYQFLPENSIVLLIISAVIVIGRMFKGRSDFLESSVFGFRNFIIREYPEEREKNGEGEEHVIVQDIFDPEEECRDEEIREPINEARYWHGCRTWTLGE